MSKNFISNRVLKDVLKNATNDELLTLTKIINPDSTVALKPKTLQEDICWEGGHGIINVLYRFGDGTGYLDIVDEVLDELEITGLPSYNSQVKYYDEISSLRYKEVIAEQKGIDYVEQAEEKIILKLLEIAYKNMSDKEKKTFDEQMNIVANQFNSNIPMHLTGAAGLMVLANLGGFSTYVLLTTFMSTITVGTLGFGAYTTATTLMSIMIGPVGWAGLGLGTLLMIGKPEYQKLIPIVAIVGAIRQRIKYEAKLSIGNL